MLAVTQVTSWREDFLVIIYQVSKPGSMFFWDGTSSRLTLKGNPSTFQNLNLPLGNWMSSKCSMKVWVLFVFFLVFCLNFQAYPRLNSRKPLLQPLALVEIPLLPLAPFVLMLPYNPKVDVQLCRVPPLIMIVKSYTLLFWFMNITSTKLTFRSVRHVLKETHNSRLLIIATSARPVVFLDNFQNLNGHADWVMQSYQV